MVAYNISFPVRRDHCCFSSLTWNSKEFNIVLPLKRQCGQMVRVLDLQFRGPEFKSRCDRYLDLFSVVSSSNTLPHLKIAS